MSNLLHQMAGGYFAEMALRFPVMCASDEFHFMPRAEAADRYLDRMEDLSAGSMEGAISWLKAFRSQCEGLQGDEDDLEDRIDVEMLLGNVAGALLELEEKAAWRHNPLLYLKIAFIGLDHALTKPAPDDQERRDRVRARLDAIPRLLEQGCQNLEGIPADYHSTALTMIPDCRDYLHRMGKEMSTGETGRSLERIIDALEAFERALRHQSPGGLDCAFSVPSVLETTLRDHFRSRRDLDEIFEIGVDEWHRCVEALKGIQEETDPGGTWQALYQAYCSAAPTSVDTITRYATEARGLAEFLADRFMGTPGVIRGLEVVPTPTYLRSVRGSASFSAALRDREDAVDRFYIAGDGETDDDDRLKQRLYRECPFLTAHETIPGHQLLDSVRRSLKNPIRRQIESALFYEGWAYYAESLLLEYGYVTGPMARLVDLKRRLWRAARCQVDVGLNTGQLTKEGAIGLISTAGFSRDEAHRQVERFKLNPGYQLCYTLGRYEIWKLRQTHAGRMGLEGFHHTVLTGGEIPFHLAEMRFERRKAR